MDFICLFNIIKIKVMQEGENNGQNSIYSEEFNSPKIYHYLKYETEQNLVIQRMQQQLREEQKEIKEKIRNKILYLSEKGNLKSESKKYLYEDEVFQNYILSQHPNALFLNFSETQNGQQIPRREHSQNTRYWQKRSKQVLNPYEYKPNSYFIYALRFQLNGVQRFYIGKTRRFRIFKRFAQHCPPEDLKWKGLLGLPKLHFLEQLDSIHEQRITKQYMFKYGIHKVRGGIFSYPKIFKTKLGNILIPELEYGFGDKCYGCWKQNCVCREQQRISSYKTDLLKKPIPICTKCNLLSHSTKNCDTQLLTGSLSDIKDKFYDQNGKQNKNPTGKRKYNSSNYQDNKYQAQKKEGQIVIKREEDKIKIGNNYTIFVLKYQLKQINFPMYFVVGELNKNIQEVKNQVINKHQWLNQFQFLDYEVKYEKVNRFYVDITMKQLVINQNIPTNSVRGGILTDFNLKIQQKICFDKAVFLSKGEQNCHRCGQQGHNNYQKSNCQEKKYRIQFCSKCGDIGHSQCCLDTYEKRRKLNSLVQCFYKCFPNNHFPIDCKDKCTKYDCNIKEQKNKCDCWSTELMRR